MYDEEKKRAEEEDYNLAKAQQLADEWAQEEQRKRLKEEKHETEKAFANAQRLADARARQDEFRRGNEEKSARDAAKIAQEHPGNLDGDRETASQVRRVRRQPMKFEHEGNATNPGTTAKEHRRRTVPDNARTAALNFESEKETKLKRERSYAQEPEERSKARRESTRNRHSSPSIPLERVPRLYQQTYSSQQRASLARAQQRPSPTIQRNTAPSRNQRPTPVKIECVSCMEPSDKARMEILSCKHVYCGPCISGKCHPQTGSQQI